MGLDRFACRLLSVAAVALGVGAVGVPGALAAGGVPAWSISSLAHPARFAVGDPADLYELTVTNTGSAPAEPAGGAITISDALPVGLRAVGIEGHDLQSEGELACSLNATPHCVDGGSVPAGDTLFVKLRVEVTSARGAVLNSATVTGGDAAPVSTSEPLTLPTPIGEAAEPFGIAAVGMEARDALGRLDSQAASHPYGVTTTFHLNTQLQSLPTGERPLLPVADMKDVVVDLPLGLAGDPSSAARCSEADLLVGGGSACPPASRVGTLLFYSENVVHATVSGTPAFHEISAVYNMVPEPGYPAQFAFTFFGLPAPIYASLVHTASGYALRALTPGIPKISADGVAVTLFGDPNTANGDTSSPHAFFTNPANCTTEPLRTRVEADSWSDPGHWAGAESVAYPQITGCNLLQFEPAIELHPEVSQAEAPTGYDIKIRVPQSPSQLPILATPDLKDVTMTLPAGMTVSPGAGDGLAGCEETGPNGIDMPGVAGHPDEAGEGEAIGPDGMAHLTPGHCPPASQVGTVSVVTPVLEKPLEGHVYVAQPQCGGTGQPACTAADATNGRLFGIYLEAEGSGAVVKLKGSVSVNPATGQLTARFLNNPQLPFSEVSLHLKGGGRAPLANPRQCGSATTISDLTPWSSPVTPDSIASSPPFPVSWDGNGALCPGTLPFAPTLSAGSVNTAAGGFTPFTLTLRRGDREQDLSRVQVHMPVGLLGMLSKVALCEEPQASLGTCVEASQVGTVAVEAGSGPQPLGVRGRVYLTGPYAGAPFGLTIVVPAIAGPFNLGNVVVRSRIDVDPGSSALTITSDPLPQFRDGVPLRIHTLNVTVDRPGFMFNPTSCAAKQIGAILDAEQGASASLTTPFAVEGCKNLPFKPLFKVSTSAATSKALGAALDVKVTSSPGQANIARVAVSLPRQLPARLTTLQHACPAAVFASNPATCDAASLVGVLKATTPVLPVTLEGPAYLVSHGGAAFPDLVVVLQGEGVRIDLTGNTNISKGITSSTFASVPDAPIESFELQLPRGRHSALTSNVKSLCGQKLLMPTTFTAQSGAHFKQSTKITVKGCPRAKPKPKAKAKRARHGA